jgi:hypothetical protein
MLALFLATALAADPAVGVPVKVIVTDADGKAVTTAVVRHPQEADRHKVNTFDGSWQADILYLPDGSELVFTKGSTLELEISAPGYLNQHVSYVIRGRKNVLPITLEVMPPPVIDDEDIIVGFGGDHLLDK